MDHPTYEDFEYYRALSLYLTYSKDDKRISLFRMALDYPNPEVIESLSGFVDIGKEDLEKWYKSKNLELDRKDIGYVSVLDDDYPPLLRQIKQYPIVLFYKGDYSILERRCVSIVGSRKAREDSRKTCDLVVKHLKRADVNVVSGLAFGVDSFTHKASLKYGVSAVSVLPSSVDNPIPVTNLFIARAIVESGGLLLSENPPGHMVEQGGYVKRNRIISGLSDRTLIVEAALKSGSMTTAKYALEQNRDVYAVPGSIFSHTFEGCNYLIHKGAMCLYKPEAFFDYELEGFDEIEEEDVEACPEDEVIRYISEAGKIDIDTLVLNLNMPEAELFSKVVEHELYGRISRNGKWLELR